MPCAKPMTSRAAVDEKVMLEVCMVLPNVLMLPGAGWRGSLLKLRQGYSRRQGSLYAYLATSTRFPSGSRK
jgi:hypothetical protein